LTPYWLALATLLMGCAPRSEQVAASPMGVPFVAWLEAAKDAHELTVVVMPLRALGGPIEVEVAGRRAAAFDANGGRRTFALPQPGQVRIELSWRDPSGAAGAHALLEYPQRTVAAASFVPTLGFRIGSTALVIDQAIRIPAYGPGARKVEP